MTNRKKNKQKKGEKDVSSVYSEEEEQNCSRVKPAFLGCYLLRSCRPHFTGSSYIGFTVNPRRRLRQHNGEISSGAERTRKKRPWEMILCVYGFPSKVSARKFEWAWQHPTRSVALKKAIACIKLSRGIKRKIKILYTMLILTEWNSLNLTVNFLSMKHIKHTKDCPPLPPQMKVQIGSVDEFPCHKARVTNKKERMISRQEGACTSQESLSSP